MHITEGPLIDNDCFEFRHILGLGLSECNEIYPLPVGRRIPNVG